MYDRNVLPLETALQEPHTGASILNASATSFMTTQRHVLSLSPEKAAWIVNVQTHSVDVHFALRMHTYLHISHTKPPARSTSMDSEYSKSNLQHL